MSETKRSECFTMRSLELFHGQAVDEMMASRIKDVVAQESLQNRETTDLKRPYYSKMFRGDKTVA